MTDQRQLIIFSSVIFTVVFLVLGLWYWFNFRPSASMNTQQVKSVSKVIRDAVAELDIEAVEELIDDFKFPVVVTGTDKEVVTSNLSRKGSKQRIKKGEAYVKAKAYQGPIKPRVKGEQEQVFLYYGGSTGFFNFHYLFILLFSSAIAGAFAYYKNQNDMIMQYQANRIVELEVKYERKKTSNLRKEVLALANKNKKLNNMLSGAQKKLEKEAFSKQKLQSKARAAIVPLKEENEALEAQLEEQARDLEEREEEMQAILEKRNEERDLLKHQIKRLKEKNAKIAKELQETKLEARKPREIVQSDKSVKTTQIKSVDVSKNNEKIEEIKEIKKNRQELIAKQKKQQEKSQKLERLVQKKEKEIQKLRAREQELAKRDQELRERETEIGSLTERELQMQEELKKIRANLDSKASELEGLSKNYSDSIHVLNEIVAEKEHAENSLLAMEEHIELMAHEIQALADERDLLIDEKDVLLVKIEAYENNQAGDLIKAREEEVATFQAENSQMYETIQSMQSQILALESRLHESEQNDNRGKTGELEKPLSEDLPVDDEEILTEELPLDDILDNEEVVFIPDEEEESITG